MDNKKAGYVKAYRSFKNWQHYKDINCKSIFLHLLLSCNYFDKKKGDIIVKKGEIMTSISKLAEESGLSIKQTRNALKKLQTSSDIQIKTTNKYSLITIVKFEQYQGKQKLENEQKKGKQKGTLETAEIKGSQHDNVMTGANKPQKGQAKGQAEFEERGKQKGTPETAEIKGSISIDDRQEGKQNLEKRASKRATFLRSIKEEKNINIFFNARENEKPTFEQIENYAKEKKIKIDLKRFFNYNESMGWKIDWKKAIEIWRDPVTSKISNNEFRPKPELTEEQKRQINERRLIDKKNNDLKQKLHFIFDQILPADLQSFKQQYLSNWRIEKVNDRFVCRVKSSDEILQQFYEKFERIQGEIGCEFKNNFN